MTRAIDDPNRDNKGRFVPGNKASVGVSVGKGQSAQAAKARKNEYSEATAEVVSLDDWRRIAMKARDQAIEGDRYAREWLSNYLIGRPVQRMMDVREEDNPLMQLYDELFGGGATEGTAEDKDNIE